MEGSYPTQPQVQVIPKSLTANLIDYVYNIRFVLNSITTAQGFSVFIIDLQSTTTINPSALNPTNPLGYAQISTAQDSDGQYYSTFSQGRLTQTQEYYINLEINTQHQPPYFEYQGISERDLSQCQVKIQAFFDTDFTVGMQQVPSTTKYNLLPYFKAPLGSTISTMPFFEMHIIKQLQEALKKGK